MNVYLKHFLRIAGIALGILILVFAITAIYVSVNKKEILQKLTAAVSNKIQGNVQVEDVGISIMKDFPNLSIELKNVSINDSLFEKHHHSLIHAEKIFLRLNTLHLFSKRPSLTKVEADNAGFYLFTDTSGYSNGYLLQSKKQNQELEGENTIHQILDRIILNHVSFTVNDQSKKKLFDFVVNNLEANTISNDTTLIFQIKKSSILIKALAFNLEKGIYTENHSVEGNFNVLYNAHKKELSFTDIPLLVSKQPFVFSGNFLLGNEQRFFLNIISKDILVDFAKTLLTKKLSNSISIVSLKIPVNVDAKLTGSLEGGEPLINVKWDTKNNSITTPLVNFERCSFAGTFYNQVMKDSARNDENSRIIVQQFIGDYQGLVFKADTIIIDNLTKPVLRCNMKSKFSMSALNSIFPSESVDFSSGNGQLDLSYLGSIDSIDIKNTILKGWLRFDSTNIQLHPSKAVLADCKANIELMNSDIILDTILCKLSGNPIRIWGKASNTLSLLSDAEKKQLELNLHVAAPLININHINTIISRGLPSKTASVNGKLSGLKKTADQLDELLSNGHISVIVNADKIVYHRFEANQLYANILINEDSWNLKKASLSHGTGTINITGKATEPKNSVYQINGTMQMKNVDAQKIWYAFNDFGIEDFSSKNLSGDISLSSNISLKFNKAGDFDINTLNGDADFSIIKGALINFGPVQKLQTFILKNRDFSNIRFAELKDHVTFKKGEINIDRMEINSSVLSLFVEGVYCPKGQTDISIQVPLSNLKKRDVSYNPENVGAGSKGGMSVFLRAKTDSDGTIKVKYDPFKRLRKSK
ncbi:MAG TPA: AsmA-like C-terminal region-containing protein [Puia sp.]|nr:AsmA-like C-terminal region-containing protein [Puia sp.]